ncbi:MAG: hypothetical protein ACYC75_03760 [Minisyncoccota bacterium]
MSAERPPRPESTPEADPYQAFEALTKEQQWSPETEAKLRTLLESHEVDLYMIYLNYKESGLVDKLSEYEHRLYEWLKNKFE